MRSLSKVLRVVAGMAVLMTFGAGSGSVGASASPPPRYLVSHALQLLKMAKSERLREGYELRGRSPRTRERWTRVESAFISEHAQLTPPTLKAFASLYSPLFASGRQQGPSSFRLDVLQAGAVRASRDGAGSWTCSKAALPTKNHIFSRFPLQYLTQLHRLSHMVLLKPAVSAAQPVWHVRASGVVRIQWGSVTTGNKTTYIYVKGWAVVNYFISQGDGTLRRVVSDVPHVHMPGPRGKRSLVHYRLQSWLRLSEFGQPVMVHLPSPCRKMSGTGAAERRAR